MKILITNFHQGDGGGHTTYITALVMAFKEKHDITVIAPKTSRLYQTLSVFAGVRVIAHDFKGALLKTLGDVVSFRALLRKENFDVVHVNGSVDHRLCFLAAVNLGSRRPAIVFTQHNDKDMNRLGVWVRARFGTTKVICVCDKSKRKLEKSPFSQLDITRIYNGVDVDRFSPPTLDEVERNRAHWIGSTHSGKLVIGSNAGTAEYKRWMDMVKAVTMLPQDLRSQCVVMVAGLPPPKSMLAKVHQLGMGQNVVFTGLLQDVYPFITTLDIGFVLSSGVETISFACREMMSTGVPVIVSEFSGLVENVEHGVDGWIVPIKSPEAVASILKHVLLNRNSLIPMRSAARDRAV
ncbi:MAG TPA: glycosyltransferase family 1 protein, partial [Pusillimonas sp.]|nr:glycosyltransferase family 1 protein [Pusillimonas sp.]